MRDPASEDSSGGMSVALLDIVRRHGQAHADRNGVARTPIPGLTIIRETVPGTLQYTVNRPLLALVLQGGKRVDVGATSFALRAGESLLITADIPTASQISCASAGLPYLSLVVELDVAIIEGLVLEMGSTPFVAGESVRVDGTETEVADAALRLLRLLDRPAPRRVLEAQLLRELHFWLLHGRHGGAIRCLGVVDSHARRINRAVAVIRADYAHPLRVELLAKMASMSASTFYEHFRAITSLTPLQFQKQLRLVEARRLLLSGGATVATAAHAVGYESVPQFTREYGRLFGMPPARDMREVKRRIPPAA